MLHPVDLVVLATLLSPSLPPARTQADLARRVGISQSNVHRALRNLTASGLLTDGEPRRAAFHELVVHGLKYVFPPRLGPPARGIAVTAPGVTGDSPWVWPLEDGPDHGPSLEPLHKGVPNAARSDPALREILALVDLCRVGKAQDRKAAGDRLAALLGLAP